MRIQAQVNPRLLQKADRLFTGSLEGRITEVLQNARRAGATEVHITNKDGRVFVQDDGRGIENWNYLLDLGGQGWSDATEAGEDPAGVGLFCLSPRPLIVRSKGYAATVKDGGWTGENIELVPDPEAKEGTLLEFEDKKWSVFTVSGLAVFTGMQVFVDGKAVRQLNFLNRHNAVHRHDLGCYIEAVKESTLSSFHRSYQLWDPDTFLINFYGQVICSPAPYLKGTGMTVLVEPTGEPTGIRLMLPARTRLVENEEARKLLAATELEMYKAISREGKHGLTYKSYQRGLELLGPEDFPEAAPSFGIGLLGERNNVSPPDIDMPEDFKLSNCYRIPEHSDLDIVSVRNAHLLASFGALDGTPFIPVRFKRQFEGYSWTKLPVIESVALESGDFIHDGGDIADGTLACVSSLKITVHTSDGKTFSSPVCMAAVCGDDVYDTNNVVVTPEARGLQYDIWYLLGGYNPDGGSYESYESEIFGSIRAFWADCDGPGEYFRMSLIEKIRDFKGSKWDTVSVDAAHGTVTISHNGSHETINPPQG